MVPFLSQAYIFRKRYRCQVKPSVYKQYLKYKSLAFLIINVEIDKPLTTELANVLYRVSRKSFPKQYMTYFSNNIAKIWHGLFLKVFDDISTILLYCISCVFKKMIDEYNELFFFCIETIFTNTAQRSYLPEKYKKLIFFLFQENSVLIHRLLNLLSIYESVYFRIIRLLFHLCNKRCPLPKLFVYSTLNYETLTKLWFNIKTRNLICFKTFLYCSTEETTHRKNHFPIKWSICSLVKNNSFLAGWQVQ